MDLSHLAVGTEVDALKVDLYSRASYSKLPHSQLRERGTLLAMIQLIYYDTYFWRMWIEGKHLFILVYC